RADFSPSFQLLREARHFGGANICRTTFQSVSSLLERTGIFLPDGLVDFFDPYFSVRDEHPDDLLNHFLAVVFFHLVETAGHIFHGDRRRAATVICRRGRV